MRRMLTLTAALSLALVAAGCGQVGTPTVAAQTHEIYIHVDPATGCHYIVFPDGSGAVRVKPDGTPYCDTPAAAPAATPAPEAN